jgi:hypothetical protein
LPAKVSLVMAVIEASGWFTNIRTSSEPVKPDPPMIAVFITLLTPNLDNDYEYCILYISLYNYATLCSLLFKRATILAKLKGGLVLRPPFRAYFERQNAS